jgi:hypothetical protein
LIRIGHYFSTDLLDLTKFKWNELKSDDWERHFDVINWLSDKEPSFSSDELIRALQTVYLLIDKILLEEKPI